jgi:hypothetical protein
MAGFFDGTSLRRRKTARIVRAALRVFPPSPAAPQGPHRGSASLLSRSKPCLSRKSGHWLELQPMIKAVSQAAVN